jgi:hypothetical protein
VSEADEENDLRLLLELGVPHLGSPPERMPRIRRQMMRRRRRRAALAVGVAGAAAVTAFVSLMPPPTTVVPADRPTAVGTPMPTPTPSPSAVHLPDLFGLTLTLSDGWYARTVPDNRSIVPGFVANQPLPVKSSCPNPTAGNFSCAPVLRLRKGQVLISFRLNTVARMDKQIPAIGGPTRPSAGCRSIGGDREMVGWEQVANSSAKNIGVIAYACLKDVSDAALAEVKRILSSADFSYGTTAPPTPRYTTDSLSASHASTDHPLGSSG